MYFAIFRLLRAIAKKRKEKKAQAQAQAAGFQVDPQFQFNHPNQNKSKTSIQMSVLSAYKTGSGTGSTSPDAAARHPIKVLVETILRFFQFVLGVTVIGLYGQDVKHDTDTIHDKCVFAVITGSLASITAVVYLLLPFVLKDRPLSVRTGLHLPFLVWEGVLVILWLVMFGMFGKMYIGNYSGVDGARVARMRHAVWVDLTELLLWAGTAGWSFLRWWKGRTAGEKGGDLEKEGSLES